MADSVEMQDIRGLDIDKLAKGFAEESFIFKKYCQVSKMNGDSIRWFRKTAGVLTATSPSTTKNVSPLSLPETLEVTWTRYTSYPKKYFVEGFISMEDIKNAELNVLATTIRDLTRVITRDIDEDIWDVMTESQSPSEIQTFATTSVGGDQWDGTSQNPVKDLLHAKKMIADYNYNTNNLVCFMSPTDYESVITWLYSKGAQAMSLGEQAAKKGEVTEIAGIKIVVSTNVTDDYALVMVPKVATTYKENMPVTARVIKEEGVGSRIRVWANGIAYNTDPNAIVLITDTQS